MRNLYRIIENEIKEKGIETITLDIFDTVLLRKIWPEDMQFLKVSRKWIPELREVFSNNIQEYELYSLRMYTRKELLNINYTYDTDREKEYDVNLKIWFKSILEQLSMKYSVKLQKEETESLVHKMIQLEIDTEKEELIPNTELIKAIQKIKSKYKDIKVFFLSDMYLTAVEIKELLEHFKIDIFEDGLSSTDVGYAKYNGSLFNYIHNEKVFSEKYDIFNNLHIGDSLNSDVKMAKASGSNAIFYNPMRLRRLRTNLNTMKLNKIKKEVQKKDRKALKKELVNEKKLINKTWRNFGFLFSQALYSYLIHVVNVAREMPKIDFTFVSSEARVLEEYGKMLFSDFGKLENIFIANKLNRKCILRAFVWELSQNENKRYNLESIYKTINFGEIGGTRREIYEFFFGEEYPYSELNINQRTEENFFKTFLKEIKACDSKYTKHLREAHKYALKFVPDETKKIVIVDIGWGGTIQNLFSEFLKLRGKKIEVDGLYLGKEPVSRFPIKPLKSVGYLIPNVYDKHNIKLWNPVIWEYPFTSKPQFEEDYARLEQIKIGFLDGIDFFKKRQSNPKEYFDKVVRFEITRLINKPKRNEVSVLGNITFDTGFVDFKKIKIVEMDKSQLGFIKEIMRDLGGTFRLIYTHTSWTQGYIKYYRLRGIAIPVRIFKLLSKLRKKKGGKNDNFK